MTQNRARKFNKTQNKKLKKTQISKIPRYQTTRLDLNHPQTKYKTSEKDNKKQTKKQSKIVCAISKSCGNYPCEKSAF
jgi:hypothetical protein